MLLELNVKDIALIKKASVEFDRGLNILTGETGTGKSVIIDSAMLALGAKIKGDIIRRGAEYAYIELIFSIEDDARRERLKELSVYPDDNGEIVISRKIMPGRSVSRVNDETVTLGKLAEITSMLIDIYGQNEFHTLMDRKQHLKILDEYMADEVIPLKKKTIEAFKAYKESLKRAESFDMDEKERLRETDLLSHELNEIDEAAIKDGEEEELSQLYKKLNNAKNILDGIGSAYRNLESIELERAVADIDSAMRYDDGLKDIYDELLDAQSLIEACVKDIGAYADALEVDESVLTETERRLDLIRGLEAKYGKTLSDIEEYRDNIAARLKELEDYEDNKLKAEKALEKSEAELIKLCGQLTEKRKKGAARLGKAIGAELKELGFEKASIDMAFAEKKPAEDGADDVYFISALNPGESMKPLSEVASGGELSRVMLAIKTVLARTDDMPTLIFDEIDTGISGRTAQKVAEKMDVIAMNHQVICVSHLPQIAAMADTHFVIKKEEIDGRNITEITRLDEEGSRSELARLLGGAELTKAVYDNALEMKELAKKGKSKRRGVSDQA